MELPFLRYMEFCGRRNFDCNIHLTINCTMVIIQSKLVHGSNTVAFI